MPEPLAGRRTDARPLLSDYLTDAEMDRLAEVLIGLLVATERARADQAKGAAEPQTNGARPG
jgi:hypothetical protein